MYLCYRMNDCNAASYACGLYFSSQKTSQDVRFLAPQRVKEEQTEYSTTLKSPWMATKSEKKKQKEKEKEDATNTTDTIELIASVKDVQSTLDFEALICYVSIGGRTDYHQNKI